MMQIPFFYIKDKQAFSKKQGILLLVGTPVALVKKLKAEGADLIHFVDLDALNGSQANLDVYDKLTYLTHIQVEGVKDEKSIKNLISIGVRVVISLPTKFDLSKFKEKKRLLVGKLDDPTDVSGEVFDIIYSGSNQKELDSLLNSKRRIVFAGDPLLLKKLTAKKREKLFGIIG